MNTLHEAKQRIQDAYYDERGMAETMRKDAAVYAAIAQAEALQRIADALGQIAVTLDLGTSPTMGRIPDVLMPINIKVAEIDRSVWEEPGNA
jgi:hypothetical protein